MKKKTLFRLIMVIVTLLATFAPQSVRGQVYYELFNYEFDENTETVTITGLSDYYWKKGWMIEEIVVPATIKERSERAMYWIDYKVVIADQAFHLLNDKHTWILEDGIDKIGKEVFCDNLLTEIEIPSSVKTIGENAFTCAYDLQSIVIPKGVEVIEQYAFKDCHNLTSVELPEGLKEIGEGAFMLNQYELKSLVLPSTIEKLGKHSLLNIWCADIEVKCDIDLQQLKDALTEDYYLLDGIVHKNFNQKLEVQLTDKSKYRSPSEFTASKVTYSRNIVKDGGKYSFMVPFDIPADQAAELGKFYKYDHHANGKVYFAEETEGVKANTAYFLDPASDITSITVNNAQMRATNVIDDATAPTTPGLYGTYDKIAIPEGAYGYGADGTFVKAGTGNTLSPFRAYLWLGEDTPMANVMSVFGLDDVEDATDINITEAEDLNTNAPNYNLSGQRVKAAKKGEILIQNGKKVVMQSND